ncbi:hypothetical protein [Streptomyces cellostaticus]|uniref:hypothetical protein n=1 Tax=Streptomyces cellostaticus TaxID=67285 RepID=UPI001FC9A2DF|nr:hypothetical protein [Streptomyces cellostaticus]
MAALVGGCSSTHGEARPAPHTSSPSSGSTEHAPRESVTKAPVLPEGEVVAQAVNATGNRELDIRGGLKRGALTVDVNCQGKGQLTVMVKPVGLNFSLKCVDGKVTSTSNQLELKRTREHGTVSVTAPSRVRWALTVGR